MLVRSQVVLSCILWVSCGLGSTSFVKANTLVPQPVARYTFTSEQCKDGSFTDTPKLLVPQMPSFSRNPTSTKCSKGLGVESASTLDSLGSPPLSMAKSNVNKIFDHVAQTDNGISFEFWLKPLGEDRDSSSTIFTVGSKDGYSASDGRTICNQEHFDLQLVQVGNKFQVTFRNGDTFFQPCFIYPVFDFPVQPGKLVHIVISLRAGQQQVFLNAQGETVANEKFDNNLYSWNGKSDMQFFSPAFGSGARTENQENLWRGSIYQFSVYDRALSRQEVERSLTAGLSGGQPYSLPYQVVLNEDAERVPGSHAPEWYASPPMLISSSRHETDDLQGLPLRIGDVEKEVHDLLVSVNLVQASSQDGGPASSPQFIYITGLPSKGSLFQFADDNYIALQHVPQQSDTTPLVILIEDPTSLIFLPTFNEFSVIPGAEYTNLAYCVTDHLIFDPLQCESSVISIFVEPVNDPPIAFSSPLSLATVEGLESEHLNSIELGGTDVDRLDSISAIQITEPPRWGTLVLRVTDFRIDGLVHDTVISETGGFAIASQQGKSIHVKYIFGRSDPGNPRQPIPGNGGSDFFHFRVSDQHGAWSLQESVRIDIASALTARHTEAQAQSSGGNTNITTALRGDDTSGHRRPLAFFIETVPNNQDGWLLQSNTNKRLLAGSTVPTDGDGADDNIAAITFVTQSNSCNSTPLVTTANFTYRAIALEDGAITSASPVVTQSLEVQCVNIPTLELSTAITSLTLASFSLSSAREIGCGATVYDHPRFSAACSTVAGIDGIKVKAPEYHASPAIVTILSRNGFVTFHDKFWPEVRPIRGRRNLASEQVTFHARAEDLEDVLSGLSFRSQTIGDDELFISVRYGDCPGVLANEVTTGKSTCQRVNLQIPVFVTKGETDALYKPAPTTVRWQVFFCWIGYPIIYAILSRFWDRLVKLFRAIGRGFMTPLYALRAAFMGRVRAVSVGRALDSATERVVPNDGSSGEDNRATVEKRFIAFAAENQLELAEGGYKWIMRDGSDQGNRVVAWWNIENEKMTWMPPPLDSDEKCWDWKHSKASGLT